MGFNCTMNVFSQSVLFSKFQSNLISLSTLTMYARSVLVCGFSYNFASIQLALSNLFIHDAAIIKLLLIAHCTDQNIFTKAHGANVSTQFQKLRTMSPNRCFVSPNSPCLMNIKMETFYRTIGRCFVSFFFLFVIIRTYVISD